MNFSFFFISTGDNLTHPTIITPFLQFQPEGHREPRNEVGSLNPVKPLVGIETQTFRF